mmetsp:Transcript_9340/g.8787  ORF Transcript_9340/g.8787 Transcript_9340/m.8787 type:complete len:208 (-) Transcript_9340:193-816(-)
MGSLEVQGMELVHILLGLFMELAVLVGEALALAGEGLVAQHPFALEVLAGVTRPQELPRRTVLAPLLLPLPHPLPHLKVGVVVVDLAADFDLVEGVALELVVGQGLVGGVLLFLDLGDLVLEGLVHVLDGHVQPVPALHPHELVIAGPCLRLPSAGQGAVYAAAHPLFLTDLGVSPPSSLEPVDGLGAVGVAGVPRREGQVVIQRGL